MSSPDLTWRALSEARDDHSLALAVGPRGPTRRLVLSNLAAELVRQGARTLWIGSQRVARPLAWLPLSEQRLDARPLRSTFGGPAWPRVNPFQLEPAYAGRWLADRLPGATPKDHEELGRAVGKVLAFQAGRLRRWRPPTPRQGLEALTATGPERFRTDLLELAEQWSEPGAPPLRFDDDDLTVLCGHRSDLEARREDVALSLLAFASAAIECGPRPALVVIEDWLDWVGPEGRTLVADALLDVAESGAGSVLLATDRPAAWEADGAGRCLLGAATPVIAPGAGSLPAAWRAPARPAGDPSSSESAYVLTTGPNPRWLRHRLPRPATPRV